MQFVPRQTHRHSFNNYFLPFIVIMIYLEPQRAHGLDMFLPTS